MVDKCYIAVTRQATDNVTLSFTNNYDKSCTYNSEHVFGLTVIGGDGTTVCTSLSFDDLEVLGELLRNLQDISNAIPRKDNIGY